MNQTVSSSSSSAFGRSGLARVLAPLPLGLGLLGLGLVDSLLVSLLDGVPNFASGGVGYLLFALGAWVFFGLCWTGLAWYLFNGTPLQERLLGGQLGWGRSLTRGGLLLLLAAWIMLTYGLPAYLVREDLRDTREFSADAVAGLPWDLMDVWAPAALLALGLGLLTLLAGLLLLAVYKLGAGRGVAPAQDAYQG